MTSDAANENARVREYLLAQGSKYTWVELWPRVTEARLGLLDALRDVSEEQARFKPAPDEWSIAEVAQHVARDAQNAVPLIEALAAGRQPEGGGSADPPRDAAESGIDVLRAELLASSVQLAGLADRLPEPPNMEAVSPHVFFGDLHCKAWYLFQRVHDGDHAQQIAAVKQTPGYPDSEETP